MADAYVVNLTTGATTKNAVSIANIRDVTVTLRNNLQPGVLEGTTSPVNGFTLKIRAKDTNANNRILAQGPSGLLASIAAIAGFSSEYVIVSKPGDTLQLTSVPGTIYSANLETASVDGAAP
jgi:hypothetical protein